MQQWSIHVCYNEIQDRYIIANVLFDQHGLPLQVDQCNVRDNNYDNLCHYVSEALKRDYVIVITRDGIVIRNAR